MSYIQVTEIRDGEVLPILQSLTVVYGVRPKFDGDECKKLFIRSQSSVLFDKVGFRDCCLMLLRHIGLANNVKIHLLQNDSTEIPLGSVAQIRFPVPMPYLGTPDFTRMVIQLYIRKKLFLDYDSFVSAFAHEMSHLLLEGIVHPLRVNEPAVDLLGMLIGFWEHSYQHQLNAREFVYGYLERSQVVTAYQFLEGRYPKNGKKQFSLFDFIFGQK